MTDHKFTDEEVIKAFECCSKVKGIDEVEEYCSICPFWDEACATLLPQSALDLINRQKEEIERFVEVNKTYSEVRAEAIKEFAERLKLYAYMERTITGYQYHVVDVSEIDNLVKEMTEGRYGL